MIFFYIRLIRKQNMTGLTLICDQMIQYSGIVNCLANKNFGVVQ